MRYFNLDTYLVVHAGRPKKGEAKPNLRMINRTVKLPVQFWDDFEKKASALGLSRHEALRVAALQFLYPEEEKPEFYQTPATATEAPTS
jgi:hypothetical protein